MIYNSFALLNEQVKNNLNQNNFDGALLLVKNFVDQIICNNFLHGVIIDIQGIDDLCLEIGKKAISSINMPHNSQCNEESSTILYIASQLYAAGGHTAASYRFHKSPT